MQFRVGDRVEFVDHLGRDLKPVWKAGILVRRVGEETGKPLWVVTDDEERRRTRSDAEVRPLSSPESKI